MKCSVYEHRKTVASLCCGGTTFEFILPLKGAFIFIGCLYRGNGNVFSF